MDKFAEEAFKKAVLESEEARAAYKAWEEYSIPALLASIEDLGSESVHRLIKIVSSHSEEDIFFGVCQIFFFAGFNCGRGES